ELITMAPSVTAIRVHCTDSQVFLFYWYGGHRDLHSFPTRRSSDLDHAAFADRRTTHSAHAGARERLRHHQREQRRRRRIRAIPRSEEHTSELQSRGHLVCRLLLEKKKLFWLYTLPASWPCGGPTTR